MSTIPSLTTMMEVIAKVAAADEESAAKSEAATPTFAPVPHDPFADKLPRRESDRSQEITRVDFTPPPAMAFPTSLSIDDASVQVRLFNLGMNRRIQRSPRATLVDTPSIVDATLADRRIAQIDQVMHDLEDTNNFWNTADLLLQDSWLNGYRGTFFEQKENLVEAAESYKRALKLYALALKLDRLTAKSSPHIISYYYLLKRFANVLLDARLPQELADMRTVNRLHDQMEIIRIERAKWGMNNPEKEDEPFTYAGTILKVLCT